MAKEKNKKIGKAATGRALKRQKMGAAALHAGRSAGLKAVNARLKAVNLKVFAETGKGAEVAKLGTELAAKNRAA